MSIEYGPRRKATQMMVDVPMDMYQSATEVLIVIPLWWVKKESIKINITGHILKVSWVRTLPMIADKYVPMQEQCFWGTFEKTITLPEKIYYEKIYSELSTDNILKIVVPKLITPETVAVVIR
jgi:HSP20 family molecular chaperone IbpA